MIRSVVFVIITTLALIMFRRVMVEAQKLAQRAQRRVSPRDGRDATDPRRLPTLRRDPATGVYRVSEDRL
ncbi:hypothetical protein [Rhodoligotrophos defluvii]|uniref:hypothetical protein n=1 Tax=Rhodoligotrophos defluvii TaxID=2561934 RepID=UPI0010C98A80|nr:hypothetical protein [Rhodoligotrophos defluvii]